MATTKGIIPETVTDVFNGQSDVAIFDAPTNGYTSTTTLADVTASGFSLGQIVEDSTSWDGDEPSVDLIKDEQGDTIVANTTAGTYAMSFDVANLSTDMVKKLLKGKIATVTAITDGGITTGTEVVKLVDLPVQTAPIAVFNEQNNKFMLFPKAKIVGSLKLDGKLWRVNIKATAEYINTPELGTCTFGKGAANYSEEAK